MALNVRAYRVELLSPCPAGPGAAGGFEGDGVADEPVVTAGGVLETVVLSASIILQKISPMPSASAIAAMMLHLLCRLASVIESLRSLASEFLPLSGLNSLAIPFLVVGLGNQRLPAGERSKTIALLSEGPSSCSRSDSLLVVQLLARWRGTRQGLPRNCGSRGRRDVLRIRHRSAGKNRGGQIADLPESRRTASTRSRST